MLYNFAGDVADTMSDISKTSKIYVFFLAFAV